MVGGGLTDPITTGPIINAVHEASPQMVTEMQSPAIRATAQDINPTIVPRPSPANPNPHPDPSKPPPFYEQFDFQSKSDASYPEWDLNKISDVCPETDRDFFDNLLSVQNNFSVLNYDPAPSIHCESAVSYYKYVLNANDLVLNTLLYGYKPVFSVKPLPSFERNNKTARADLDFVRDEVSNLLIKGAVVKLDYQPTIVSPLSVSTRIDCLTKKSKKRNVLF